MLITTSLLPGNRWFPAIQFSHQFAHHRGHITNSRNSTGIGHSCRTNHTYCANRLIRQAIAANVGSDRLLNPNGGYVGIGTTAPGTVLTIRQTADGFGGGLTIKNAAATQIADIVINNVGTFFFRGGAALNCGTLSITGVWGTCSDRELKKNILPLERYGLREILALEPVEYIFKSSDLPGIGFIAQDVEKVIPELVSGQEGEKGVGYGHLTVVLTSAIQELNAEVASQQLQIDELEARMTDYGSGGILGGTTISITSGSADVTTTSSSGLTIPDVLVGLANNVITKFQNIWTTGDVIAEGIKKTYYSAASAFDWEFDLGLMTSGWNSREITFAPDTDTETRSLFSGNAAQAADESKLNLEQEDPSTGSGQAYLATYGVDSARGEIYLSGSAEINSGEAKIFFDFSFTSVISQEIPLKVLLTPTTIMQGQLYVANKTPYGFVVKSLNGAGNGKFDWLVIARRKGYEGNDVPLEQSQESGGTNQEPIINEPITETASSSELLTESSTGETPASSSEETVTESIPTEPIFESTASASEPILVEPIITETASTSEPLTEIEPISTASQSENI